MNECGTCGIDFASVTAFDRHRVGKHAFTHTQGLRMKPPREDGRRCLDTDEMAALGMAISGRGRWAIPGNKDRFVRWQQAA